MGDKHPAHRRMLLEAIGQVDGVAGGGKFAGLAKRSEHDQTCMDPDAHLHGWSSTAFWKFTQASLERQSCPNCSFRIILPCLPRSEHRHDRIPDVFLNRAAVRGDDSIEPAPKRN